MAHIMLLSFVEQAKSVHLDTTHAFKNIIITTDSKNSSWYSSCITILLALLAGLIALFQVRSNTISSSRITWIENLRIAISEYCNTVILVGTHQENYLHNLNNDPNQCTSDYEKYLNAHSECTKLGVKILLYLNPDKPLHNEIIQAIEKNGELLKKPGKEISKDEIPNNIEIIINASQKIFRQEWAKSKKLFKL